MGNYVGSTWSPAYMDDMESSNMHESKDTAQSRRDSRNSRDSRNGTSSNIEIVDGDDIADKTNSDIGSLLGSVASSLASNTVLQPNFIRDQSIITAMHSPNSDPRPKQQPQHADTDNISATHSEFEYLQTLFPHLHKTQDVSALREGPHSAISADTVSTQYYQNANHPKLITAPINHYIAQPQPHNTSEEEEHHRVIEVDEVEPHDLEQPLICSEKKKSKKKSKTRKKKKKKKKQRESSPPTLSNSVPLTFRSYKHSSMNNENGCCYECLTMLFYILIAIVSVCLIFGSLLVDICMAIFVYWPGTFASIYFIPCVIAIALTLISYSLNSCCFFIHTDYCSCMGPSLAPFCRCLLS
eukprot:232101_1